MVTFPIAPLVLPGVGLTTESCDSAQSVGCLRTLPSESPVPSLFRREPHAT